MISNSEIPEEFDPQSYLDKVSSLDDDEIDLAHAALALSALSHTGVSVSRYLHHLKTIGEEVGARFHTLCKQGKSGDVETRLQALRDVLVDKFAYCGDSETYDDLQNASLIRVIDRAKGLPITLSILYIHAARAQGWEIAGLNVPGHFVCRLEDGPQRVLFDPFNDGEILEAPDLRDIVKKALGPNAELSADYYEAASNRDILMRLQNNIKFRQIEAEDYAGALKIVQQMQIIDPDEYRLFLDAGVLYARTDHLKDAIDSLVTYIEKAPNSRDRMEAELLLQQLNDQLQ